jgi:serine-type D-Ala-D-Ala carboxypeptidase/endopeptidase
VSFEDLVRDRIASPLRLRDTVVHLNANQQPRRADGHSRAGRPVPDWHFPGIPAAGALWSTVDDLVVFAAAHLNRTRRLSQSRCAK